MVTKNYKLDWQRKKRAEFKAEYGYSMTAAYRAGMQRERILKRDNHRCVRCGMTDADHRLKWGRPITLDHIDRNRQHNTDENLQTLCLRCHGSKDISPALTIPQVVHYKESILARRASGQSFRAIASEFGFSVGAIWKCLQKWEGAGSL